MALAVYQHDIGCLSIRHWVWCSVSVSTSVWLSMGLCLLYSIRCCPTYQEVARNNEVPKRTRSVPWGGQCELWAAHKDFTGTFNFFYRLTIVHNYTGAVQKTNRNNHVVNELMERSFAMRRAEITEKSESWPYFLQVSFPARNRNSKSLAHAVNVHLSCIVLFMYS